MPWGPARCLIGALGYQSGSQEPVPVGPALLAGVPALLILVAPGVAAVHYGRRAHRAGCRKAIVPAWIGGMTAVVVVAQNALAFLVGR